MDNQTERAYKRICFQGRGIVARWLDRAFFSALGGVSLYILSRRAILSGALFVAMQLSLVLWDRKRWDAYRHKLWQAAAKTLRREDWLRQTAARIRQEGGVILYPTPDRDELTGHCLRCGQGTSFHCFGDTQEELGEAAASLDCAIVFHPWQEGSEPSRERVLARLRRNAPKPRPLPWQRLADLPGNRYLVAGCLLLLLSMCLRKALYWRLLGSLCLTIGAVRRTLRLIPGT